MTKKQADAAVKANDVVVAFLEGNGAPAKAVNAAKKTGVKLAKLIEANAE